MVYPSIEVTLAKVGNHVVEDKSTEDGQQYRKAFHDGATSIPGCLVWGEVDKPVLSDPSGYSELGSGRGGVLACDWRSKDQFEHDVATPRTVNAYKAIEGACEFKDLGGVSLAVTENTEHIQSWKTLLPLKDRTEWLPAAGIV